MIVNIVVDCEEEDAVVCLLEFVCLPRSKMLFIIKTLYCAIYGNAPEYLHAWSSSDMLTWFRYHYTFDDVDRVWKWTGCTSELRVN